MANINKNELTWESIEKAMACKTAEDLMKLAKDEGYELTVEEAEAYLAEFADIALDDETLKKAAGGDCYTHCADRTCKLKDDCPQLCPTASA